MHPSFRNSKSEIRNPPTGRRGAYCPRVLSIEDRQQSPFFSTVNALTAHVEMRSMYGIGVVLLTDPQRQLLTNLRGRSLGVCSLLGQQRREQPRFCSYSAKWWDADDDVILDLGWIWIGVRCRLRAAVAVGRIEAWRTRLFALPRDSARSVVAGVEHEPASRGRRQVVRLRAPNLQERARPPSSSSPSRNASTSRALVRERPRAGRCALISSSHHGGHAQRGLRARRACRRQKRDSVTFISSME